MADVTTPCLSAILLRAKFGLFSKLENTFILHVPDISNLAFGFTGQHVGGSQPYFLFSDPRPHRASQLDTIVRMV